jgi:hypothetical protein
MVMLNCYEQETATVGIIFLPKTGKENTGQKFILSCFYT